VTTALEVRACCVCGLSIEDRRGQTTTCSDACRQAKRRGAGFEPGACRGCGRELIAGREQRWHCSRECALKPTAAVRVTAPSAARPCGCGHSAAVLDVDGQRVCLSCGRPKSRSPRPKFDDDDPFALMVTDADGQYRQRPRRLNYGLDHLRTRLAPTGAGLPAVPRTCTSCGAYVRRGRVKALCDSCADEAS
jgi:hypothetical protein